MGNAQNTKQSNKLSLTSPALPRGSDVWANASPSGLSAAKLPFGGKSSNCIGSKVSSGSAGSSVRPEPGGESRANLIVELREARVSKGWSRKVMAKHVGVSPQTITRLEKGVGTASTLVAVMDSTNFMLTGLSAGKTLFEKLRNTRIKHGKSLENLVRRTGLSHTAILDLENGAGSVEDLLRLLAALAPRARRQAPARAYWALGQKEDRDSRFTPPDFMDNIYKAFGEIDLDPCAHKLSPVLARRKILASKGGDGLSQTWSGRLAFVNPPYSCALQWLRRAHEQWSAGHVDTVVCLVPVRTDSAFFHEVLSLDADIFFLKGRVKFLKPDGTAQQTPFSLMVLTLGANAEQRARYAQLAAGFWSLRRQPNDTDL